MAHVALEIALYGVALIVSIVITALIVGSLVRSRYTGPYLWRLSYWLRARVQTQMMGWPAQRRWGLPRSARIVLLAPILSVTLYPGITDVAHHVYTFSTFLNLTFGGLAIRWAFEKRRTLRRSTRREMKRARKRPWKGYLP